MSLSLSKLKTGGRAALIALTLGAASVTAMPAMAQSEPSFSFRFGIGGGGDGFSYRIDDGRRIRRDCLTNNEIRRGLRRNGFDDIRFADRSGRRVQVIADFGRRTFSMTVNRCTGRVSNIERIRAGRPGRPGFGLQFEFGN